MTVSGIIFNADEIPGVMTQGDGWVDIPNKIEKISSERIVVSTGPVHPSTHGVLYLILKLDGETVRETRVDTGYLHIGIERTIECRTLIQGTAPCIRMDYIAPLFQEAAYYLAIEKLLSITDDTSERANPIHVMMTELSHIISHLVAIDSTDNEMGAITIMTITFHGREEILRIFERIAGPRISHACIRPGGVIQDIGESTIDYIREFLPECRHDVDELEDLTRASPIFKKRPCNVTVISLNALVVLGTTGPGVRAAGLPTDLHRSQPYCGYETFDFDIPVADQFDVYNHTMVRFDECYQSPCIIYQVLERLEKYEGAPVMVADPAIAWPAQFSIASNRRDNSLEHIREVMDSSMESLIHYFRLVTEGLTIPAEQVYQTIECAKGILGVHLVSDDGARLFRAHLRNLPFANPQVLAMATEGDQLADAVISLVAIDSVLEGIDR